METKLDLTNKLAVNLQIVQSTKILQMSATELAQYIANEIVANPVIEFESMDSRYCSLEECLDHSDYMVLSQEKDQAYSTQSSEQGDWIWNYAVSKQETLTEYLLSQLITARLSDIEWCVAYYVASSLDRNGFLTESTEMIASTLSTSSEIVDKVLALLKGLEPIGVCASSLSECLLIQLRHLNADEVTCVIASEHLDLVAKKRYDILAKKVGCTEEQARLSCEMIVLLDPKPGSRFSSNTPTIFIEPDVVVSKNDDQYSCLARSDILPKLNVNESYTELLKGNDFDNAKEYLRDCMQQAKWLIHCVEQRTSTVQKVVTAIIDKQRAFFEYGPEMLKPLNLATITEMTGFHESTVSRAINNKYLRCSWGTFPLKYFFPSAVNTSSGANLTAAQIKLYIVRIISNEDKNAPLSDLAISEMLRNSGVSVSRRTVAKYRDELGIASSAARKFAYDSDA